MKVFSCPEAVPFNGPMNWDAKPGDPDHWKTLEKNHAEALKQHLLEMGHTGKYTGEIACFRVGDGHAQYMLADGTGRYGKPFLIHLPYGDAYSYRGIEHFTKKAIVETIERQNKMASIFWRQKVEA